MIEEKSENAESTEADLSFVIKTSRRGMNV